MTRMRLDYWGQSISGEIDIRGTRATPRVFDERDAVIGHGVGPADATGARSHYLLVECSCSRVALLPSYELVDGDELVSERRAVEVDAQLAPLTTPLEARPLYGRRTWIVEYRVRRGATITRVNQFGTRRPLPRRVITPDTAVRDALAQQPFDDF